VEPEDSPDIIMIKTTLRKIIAIIGTIVIIVKTEENVHLPIAGTVTVMTVIDPNIKYIHTN
jgi:hypothetical protein